jgi:hypothetical protein
MRTINRYMNNCASCQLHQPIGNRHLVTDSDPARVDLRRRIEARLQQRRIPAHTPDYIAGILAACWPVPGFIADEFRRLGIDRTILEKVSLSEGAVVWVDAHRFEFAQLCRSCGSGEGEPAFIIPIHDFEDRCCLEYLREAPRHLALGTWLGIGWALGQSSVLRPRLSEELPVHRTPLSWLGAGAKGIVVLNVRLARSYLGDAGPLMAEDAKHRRELAAALAQPVPRILVPSTAPAAKEG